jgi:hypothetical protein
MIVNFKVGDRVTARRDNPQYGISWLPKDTLGTVVDLIDAKKYRVTVKWDSGKTYYLEEDSIEHAIHDTKLNRILYPELVPENGYMRAKK